MDAESRTGYIQARMLVRYRPVLAVFVNKPKEKVCVIFQNYLLAYHSTKPIEPARPEVSLDLFKSVISQEDRKENRWRIKSNS